MTEPILWPGLRSIAGLMPFVLFFSMACGSRSNDAPHGQSHTLDPYALLLETPGGWTGGGAGGTYEFHSPDGQGRVRVSHLEGTTPLAALKDVQLLAGTGATPVSRLMVPSPTKVGGLTAMRAQFAASDGRHYEVLALQLGTGIVLVQTSVSADYAEAKVSETEALFASFRQSLRYLGPPVVASTVTPSVLH